jgi:hypothetical protein
MTYETILLFCVLWYLVGFMSATYIVLVDFHGNNATPGSRPMNSLAKMSRMAAFGVGVVLLAIGVALHQTGRIQ